MLATRVIRLLVVDESRAKCTSDQTAKQLDTGSICTFVYSTASVPLVVHWLYSPSVHQTAFLMRCDSLAALLQDSGETQHHRLTFFVCTAWFGTKMF